jgi:putative hemolysin
VGVKKSSGIRAISIIIFICLIGTRVYGKTYKTWKIGNDYRIFISNSKKLLTISRSCGDNLATARNCMASSALMRVNLDILNPHNLRGGKNPGSVLCKLSVGGTVVFGKDIYKGHVTSFCQFKDGSMVSSDSLYHYAKVNDLSNK